MLENPVTEYNSYCSPYEKIDVNKLSRLSKEHKWILKPIDHASATVLGMPFFTWIKDIESPVDFKQSAQQLYFHSAKFPKVMGLMLGLTPMSENHMMPFYAQHAYSEASHCTMLMDWMLKYHLLLSAEDIKYVVPTIETNACVNYAYQMAIEQDREKWLVGINCGIERCSNHFFKVIAPKMHSLNAGDEYFDLHVEADEYHSIMGLEHTHPHDPDSLRGQVLIATALEGISLWAAMLHSWIGIDLHPKFNLDGSLAKSSQAAVSTDTGISEPTPYSWINKYQ